MSNIRATKHSLNESNNIKLDMLDTIFVDYQTQLEMYIQDILDEKLELKTNLSSKILPNYTISHSQWKQIIYKQASQIVRSNIKYSNQRTKNKYDKVYSYFSKKNRQLKFLSKRYSELNIDKKKRIKINIKKISLNLDNRIFNVKTTNNRFNEFVLIRTPYCTKIKLPIKYYDYMKKYLSCNRKNTIQIKKDKKGRYYINLFWELPETQKSCSRDIGIDIGYNKLIVSSDNQVYGAELKQLYERIGKKQRGSNRYKKALTYKKDQINFHCKQLIKYNEDIDNLFIEDLKEVKKDTDFSSRLMNKMQYWSYKQVIDKLTSLSHIKGFNVIKVNPAYTSQMCSNCGIIEKSNRQGERYSCCRCGVLMDADYNASINIKMRGTTNLAHLKELNQQVIMG